MKSSRHQIPPSDDSLIVASFRPRPGDTGTLDDLGRALAGQGLTTVILDLTPRVSKSRQRGLAGACELVAVLEALLDPDVAPGELAAPTDVVGLDGLAANPSPDATAGPAPDPVPAFLAVLRRLLEGYDRVLVERPPVIGALVPGRIIVAPRHGLVCDVIKDVLEPLRGTGWVADRGIASEPELLAVMLPVFRAEVPGVAGDLPEGDALPPPRGDTRATPDGLLPRTYYLSPETVGSLQVWSRTLSGRLGRHVKRSEIVAVAIRTSPVLQHRELLDARGVGFPRTYYLRPATLDHLAQVALLASRSLGSHVRLSDVVELSLKLFLAEPADRQVQLLEDNRRKRDRA